MLEFKTQLKTFLFRRPSAFRQLRVRHTIPVRTDYVHVNVYICLQVSACSKALSFSSAKRFALYTILIIIIYSSIHYKMNFTYVFALHSRNIKPLRKEKRRKKGHKAMSIFLTIKHWLNTVTNYKGSKPVWSKSLAHTYKSAPSATSFVSTMT